MQGMIIKAVHTKNDLVSQFDKFSEESRELEDVVVCDDDLNGFEEELCDCIQSLFTLWNIKNGSIDDLCDYWNNIHNSKMESRNWKERE